VLGSGVPAGGGVGELRGGASVAAETGTVAVAAKGTVGAAATDVGATGGAPTPVVGAGGAPAPVVGAGGAPAPVVGAAGAAVGAGGAPPGKAPHPTIALTRTTSAMMGRNVLSFIIVDSSSEIFGILAQPKWSVKKVLRDAMGL